MMNRIPVVSSNLCSVGYDETSKMLEVEFHDSRVYQYFDVPALIYHGLMAASSHGSYLDRYVKKAGYRYLRVR